MGALPKRKSSKVYQKTRRNHSALTVASMDNCPQCHSPKLSHRVCPTCGNYNGREVIVVETKKKKPNQ